MRVTERAMARRIRAETIPPPAPPCVGSLLLAALEAHAVLLLAKGVRKGKSWFTVTASLANGRQVTVESRDLLGALLKLRRTVRGQRR